MLIDRRIEEFLAVANAGSISRAARMLYISQPTLSAQIKRLEEDLGFDLFERTPTGVNLTPQGEAFRDDMLEISRLEQRAIARGRQSGRNYQDLVIGFVAPPEAHSMSNIISEYQALYPDISVTFHTVPQDLSLRKRLVAERYVDCALANMRTSDIEDDCGFIPFYYDEECIVVSSADPLADAKFVQANDLSGRTLSIPKEERASSLITLVCPLICQELKGANADISFKEYTVDSAFIEGLRYSSEPFLTSMSIAHMLNDVVCIPLKVSCEKALFGMLYCPDASSGGKDFATFVAEYYQFDRPDQEA